MTPSDFEFSSVVTKLLGLAGVGSTVVFVVGLAFVIQSWVDAGRQAVNLGRQVHGWAAPRIPRLRKMSVAAATLLVPLAQVLLIYMCFLVGNYYSVLAGGHDRAARVQQLVVDHGFRALEFWSPWNALAVDWFSAAAVASALIAIVVSYRNALAGRRQRLTATVLALPVIWFVPLELLGLVVCGLAALFGTIDRGTATFAAALGIALAVSAVFYCACRAGLSASNVLIRAWSPPAEKAATPQYRVYRRR